MSFLSVEHAEGIKFGITIRRNKFQEKFRKKESLPLLQKFIEK